MERKKNSGGRDGVNERETEIDIESGNASSQPTQACEVN